MAITSVGSEIYKTLASGMKVSTRTEGNKVFTKLFDRDGKLLIDRTKSFERNIVGNKKVITKNEERIVNIKGANGELADSFGFKYSADRVYYKDGKFLGMRETEYKPGRVAYGSGENPLEHMHNMKHVTKSVPTYDQVFSYVPFGYLKSPVAKSFVKDIVNGVTIRKFASELIDGMKYKYRELPVGCRKPQYNNTIYKQAHAYLGEAATGGDFYETGMFLRGTPTIRYNKKGLPLPDDIGLKEYNQMENMPLKNMRQLVGENKQYFQNDMNMSF